MIITKLREELKTAMKNKDNVTKSTLQVLISAIILKEKEKKESLTEQEEFAIIQKEIKQTKEPLDAYIKVGRQDLVDEAKKKIELLEGFLPVQLSKEEVLEEIKKLLGDEVPNNKGAIMKVVMPKLKGRVEGKVINQVVSEILAGK